MAPSVSFNTIATIIAIIVIVLSNNSKSLYYNYTLHFFTLLLSSEKFEEIIKCKRQLTSRK